MLGRPPPSKLGVDLTDCNDIFSRAGIREELDRNR